MATVLDRIYSISPVWLQHLEVTAFGLVWKRRRYGGRFRSAVREYIERETYGPRDWERFQTARLQVLLGHALANVPHYRDTFARAGLTHERCERFPLADLTALPLLEKDELRRNPDAFVAAGTSRYRLHTYHTSGTTGTPLAIQFTADMHQAWSAASEARLRRWAGLDYKMSRAMIGGRLVVPKAVSKPPFWRYNWFERQLYMSAFHISPQNAPSYVAALNRFQPDYLVGYASSHFFLARMIRELRLSVYQPKAVLTSSEPLTEEMRRTIEEVYRCEVFDGYGSVECCCLASECRHHRLHVSPDVGIVELIGADGTPASPGEPGEIVATGLLNMVQPLIRYRTGDWAVLSDEPCPCGRQMPVLKELVGRLEDTVVGPEGRELVRFHGIFVGLSHIREGQVIQEDVSRFRVRLVIDPEFGDAECKAIYKRFEERLGPVTVLFEFSDAIERTERGKFRAVISKVPRPPSRRPEPAWAGTGRTARRA